MRFEPKVVKPQAPQIFMGLRICHAFWVCDLTRLQNAARVSFTYRSILCLFCLSSTYAESVIFIHPDGAGAAHWQAARFLLVGPDGELNWDKLPHVGIYRGHMANSLTATSNGGATSHAYGIKVAANSFGTDGERAGRPIAASGFRGSLMQEAMEKKIRVGVVNSGSVIEPGTACFLSSVPKRDDYEEITKQVLESGADVILSGGEEWFLPKGKAGRFVQSGARTDGLDLIDAAIKRGFTVVYDREELLAVPAGTRKLLGVFAFEDTFNDMSQSDLKASNLPTYKQGAPTLADMTRAALAVLGGEPFFLVVEEEGADNFGNANNAIGTFDALMHSDQAFGTALDFVKTHPETLLITAADSVAGNFDVIGFVPSPEKIVAFSVGRDLNGAPLGLAANGMPFLSQPDKRGVRHPFVVSWGTLQDSSGGILVRAAGKNAEAVKGSFDNTQIYEVMRRTLFEP